jgi:MoaA/NifB/PqqE/SkfB family radical SAM enzyme
MTSAPTTIRRWRKTLRTKINMPLKYAAYRRGSLGGPIFPDRIYIESTNHCNLKCIMCPTGIGVIERPKGYMDMGLYRRIIDEIGGLVGSAVLHSWGEPLMHPDLFEMVVHGKRAGIRMETSTNITLLNEERARQVLDAGLDVLYLAMDGVTKETYERVRVNAKWEKSLRNIERFIELKERTGASTKMVMQIIAMKETRAEVDAFVRRWDRAGVDQVNVKHLDTWGDQVDRITERADDADALPMERVPCPNLWYHAYVFWDGTLVSCERDFDAKTPLGNVADDGVLAAWNGPGMQALRRKHVAGDYTAPACAKCVEWSWWQPTVWHSKGTAPKVEAHAQDGP